MVLRKPNALLFALASCLIYLAAASNAYAQRYQGEVALPRIAVSHICFPVGRGITACIPPQALTYQGAEALATTVVGVHSGYWEAPVRRSSALASTRLPKRPSCSAAVPTGGKRSVLAFLLQGDSSDALFEVSNFVVDMSAEGDGIHVRYRDCWY